MSRLQATSKQKLSHVTVVSYKHAEAVTSTVASNKQAEVVICYYIPELLTTLRWYMGNLRWSDQVEGATT